MFDVCGGITGGENVRRSPESNVVGGISVMTDGLFQTFIPCRKDGGAMYVRCALAGGWHVTLSALLFRWNAVREVWTVRCQSPTGCTPRSRR